MTTGPTPIGATGDVVVGDDRPATPDQPWSWHLSRASALLLAVLIPLHFAVTFLADDIGATTARSMSERLDDPTWRLLTWLTVTLALVHATLAGAAALRSRRPGPSGTVLTAILGVIAGSLLAGATWVLATFWV